MDHAELTTPDDIDQSFVARAIDDTVQVPLGDELVLVGGQMQATVLSPTGALIWECLDGDASLDELITDLSEELGADQDVVRADVLAFARVLGEAGLLEGVGYPPPETDWDADQPAGVPPVALEEGAELDDFTAVDLDGTEHSLSEYHGRDVLLVNWSPSCGYCTMIAERLSAWQPSLEEAGVALVFVTKGDVDANRAVFDTAGLTATALVLAEGVEPFSGFGTPAAYHLDADGRLAAPMALGAFDVPLLAAALAGVDPDTAVDAVAPDNDLDDEPSDPVPDGTRYLPVAGGMCGPGGASTGSSNSTDWIGVRAYRIVDHHVGLRYNTESTAATLDALFDAARVRDRRAQDSYSVALYDSAGASSRQLNLLVQGGQQLVRSRSKARVLRALLWRLSIDVVGFDDSTGRLRVNATAALRGDDGLLLPPSLFQWVKQLQPRFGRIGVALADIPFPEIDVARGELVIPEPSIAHDGGVLASIDDDVRFGSEPPPVLPGRYPLVAWLMGRTPEDVGDLSPAVAAIAALPSVVDSLDVRERVEQLGELFTRTRGVGIWYESEAGLVDAVKHTLR